MNDSPHRLQACSVKDGKVMRVDLHRLAAAIAHTESGGDDMKLGPNGERGRYQLQEQLWHQITPAFFLCAHEPRTAERVAVRHLEWLRKHVGPFVAYDIALAWKAGPHAVKHNFATSAQKTYAERVAHRYFSNATP